MEKETNFKNNMEQTRTIPIDKCNQWFMETLSYPQREKIRVHYRLKSPTLKITNEMLKEIYETEMSKIKSSRLLESRFYDYN